MRMRIALLAVVAAGLIGWALWARGRPGGPPGDLRSEPESVQERGGRRGLEATLPVAVPVGTKAELERQREADSAATDSAEDRSGLSLRIVGADGTPVAQARVRVFEDLNGKPDHVRCRHPEGKNWPEEWTRPVPRSPLWLEVWDARDPNGEALPWGRVIHGPVAAGVFDVDIVLPPEMTIEGTVLGPGRKPVQGVAVQAVELRSDEAAEPTRIELEVGAATSDEKGRFRIGGLRAGTCLLDATPTGRFVRPPGAAVEAGARGVEIVLEVGIDVTVTVVDPQGRPLPGARVTVSTVVVRDLVVQDRDPFEGTTNEAGAIRLPARDPNARHVLDVGSPRGDLLDHFDGEWVARDDTIRLGPSLSIRGVVRDLEGRPVPGVMVHVVSRTLRVATTKTRADGAFEFGSIPEGPVDVSVRDPSGTLGPVDMTVPAGSQDVVVVLEPDVRRDLCVRIVNWPESARSISAHLASETSTRAWDQRVALDGTVTFADMPVRNAYRLWIWLPQHGQYLLASHLRALEEPHVLRLLPGKSIRGRVRTDPSFWTTIRVNAPEWTVTVAVPDSGDYEVAGLPDGTFEVVATVERERLSRTSSRRVASGDTADFDLQSLAPK